MSTRADRPAVTVRPATGEDGETVVSLIRGLAEYEKLQGPDDGAAARIIADLASDSRSFDCLLAEIDGRAVGYALFVEMYSSFGGRPRLYVEDIYVTEDARGTGAGYALLSAVAREALDRGCRSMEWMVLDWNRPAMDFYEKLGGYHDQPWLPYRMERDAIERVASQRIGN